MQYFRHFFGFFPKERLRSELFAYRELVVELSVLKNTPPLRNINNFIKKTCSPAELLIQVNLEYELETIGNILN
jgi:hypothetical protein